MAALLRTTLLARKRFRVRWRILFEDIARHALMVLVLVVTLFPIFWVFMSSFKRDVDIFVYPPAFSFQPTLAAYERVLFSPQLKFSQCLKNSVVVSLAVTALTLVTASLAGYGLARFDFPGARLISLGVLVARLLPGASVIIPYFVLLRSLRLTDTLLGLILAYASFSLPFAAWTMYGFFLEVPSDLEDSARIDGCSELGVFWRIVLPLTRPGLGATAILVFLGAWNEFLFGLVLAGRSAKTLPVFLSGFIAELYVSWSHLFAASSLMLLPAIILILLAQQHLVRGLTAGAVKG